MNQHKRLETRVSVYDDGSQSYFKWFRLRVEFSLVKRHVELCYMVALYLSKVEEVLFVFFQLLRKICATHIIIYLYKH